MADRWAEEFNGDDDDDEALNRAIAMSLGQEPDQRATPRKQPVMVDLTQDEVDLTQDDVETASETASETSSTALPVITGTETPGFSKTWNAAQKEEVKSGVREHEPDFTRVEPCAQPLAPAPAPASSSLSLLGLDRAKMEEERLARIRKRKAGEEAEQGSGSDSKRFRTNDENQRPQQQPASQDGKDAKVIIPSRSTGPPMQVAGRSLGVGHQPAGSSQQQGSALKKEHSGLPFPSGVVKKTWARGQPRLGDDIRLEEVLQRDELEMALISSFQWDQDWMLDQFDLKKTKLILVSTGGDEAENEALRASVPADRIKFCFPPTHGPGNMHSKLQILKFPTYLRIVVPTGNFVPYDWGETGVMENMVFLIDLPKIGETAVGKWTPFGEDLMYFLEAQGVNGGLVRSLTKYDFSETARYGFVHSIAGSHADDAWRRSGYCGLGRTVDALGLGTSTTVDLDVVTSSLGAVTYDFLQMIYNACQGDSGLREYGLRTAPKSKKTTDASSVARQQETLRDHVRVYFPSEKTIEQSLGGKQNAGTIFFHQRWWNQTTFPKAVLRDCRSRRPGMLMHNKVLYVRRQSGAPFAPSPIAAGFAYVGSANLSESAWGRLVKDKASGQPKLTCRNWECGVVVPVPVLDHEHGEGARQGNDRQARHQDDNDMVGMFDGCVPVPMQTPGAPYVDKSSADKVLLKPWMTT